MRVVGGPIGRRRRLVSGASEERSLAVGVAAEVKNKLSVVEVVGESVSLKKAGTTYKGLCPFHGEKTPSFVVTPARETWHCFGCGLGGDIFSFVMQRDGADVPRGAAHAGRSKAGVEIDERTKREDARRARLRQVLDTAIAFYHAVLTGSNAGRTALDYLQGRGFTDETIETFQLGWAPAGWDQMTRALQAKRDVRPEELVEVGLAAPRQSGRGASTTSSAPASCSRSATRTATRSGSAAGCSRATGRSTSTPRRRRCSTRAGRCTSSTRPRARSASRARPSSSRATRTR